jgi:hypothetical protein
VRTTRVTLLVLLLVVGLAGIGTGYALWSKTLDIGGGVHTGMVDAEWTSCLCIDQGLDPNPSGPPKDKDVGWTTCEIDSVDPEILHVTTHNGYPSYFNDCQVEFTNTGTIPVKIHGVTVTPIDFTRASAYGAGDGEIWIGLIDGVGSQLEPGDPAASSLKWHVEQPAEQNHAYHFDVAIQLNQWNEP